MIVFLTAPVPTSQRQMDFMNDAQAKGDEFIKSVNRGIYSEDWDDLWAYCGGGLDVLGQHHGEPAKRRE